MVPLTSTSLDNPAIILLVVMYLFTLSIMNNQARDEREDVGLMRGEILASRSFNVGLRFTCLVQTSRYTLMIALRSIGVNSPTRLEMAPANLHVYCKNN
jgi:hypothetical protein